MAKKKGKSKIGQSGNSGRFFGDVVALWLKDGRKMRLMEDFHFIDKSGKKWSAPEGSIVDGASIPRMFWASIGGPFSGRYRRASVLHDVACVERTEPHKKVHKMFHQAMLADKTPKAKAKEMYIAVVTFGPKWDKNGKDLTFEPKEEDELSYLYEP